MRAPREAPAVTTTEVAKPEPAKTEPAAVAKDEPVADEPVAAAKPDEPVAATAKADEPVAAKDVPAKAEVAPVTPPNLAPTAGTPAITEPLAVPGRPKLVDVRIDSKPSGATVMLVDRGKTTFLGTTPISTAVDGSRKYDLVFTYPNKPTQLKPRSIEHQPRRGRRSAGKPGEGREARGEGDRAVAWARPKPQIVTEREDRRRAGGRGVLMISASRRARSSSTARRPG
jgi:hypothetical protein